MARITIKGVDELMRAAQGFEKNGSKVAARALNRTAQSSRTEAVRLLRQLLNLKAKDIRSGVTIQKATQKNLSAAVVATGKRGLPLIKYPVRPAKPNPKRKPAIGVSVQVKRHGQRKTIPGSFVARVGAGHVGVFVRKGKSRLPIRQLYGPGFINYLKAGGRVRRKMGRHISGTLEKNLHHEIDWLIRSQFQSIRRQS